MNRFAPPKRTQADRKQEAILFIFQAADKALLAATAAEVWSRHGITARADQREVEAKLLARQAALRRQSAA